MGISVARGAEPAIRGGSNNKLAGNSASQKAQNRFLRL